MIWGESMSKDITIKMIQDFNKKYKSNPKNKLMESIINTNGIKNVALNKEAINRNQNVFSIELPKVKITNQKKSGRCWAFAGLNLFKREIAKNLNLDLENFELSQNFIIFYDKLEKANNFYEAIISFKDKDLLDREFLEILDWALYEGGYWQYFSELVKKYGIVPKNIMPETKDSEDSEVLISVLSSKARKDAIKLRNLLKEEVNIDEVRDVKQQMLQEVYDILCKTLGEPPSKFRYEYIDKDKKYNIINSITPIEFYEKYVNTSVDNYVVLGNVPMHNKEFKKLYRQRIYISNLVEKANPYFLNLEINEIKDLVIKTLKGGDPVCFDCNVRKMGNRDLEIFDDEIYQFDKVLGLDLKMNKAELLDFRDIRIQHLMVFTGVNIVKNKVERWKVENSWGDEKQNKGFYVMNDNFFDKYVLECVINKKYLTDEQLKLLQQEPIIFDPWEPMS